MDLPDSPPGRERLAGKIAIVTGAASGMGAETARLFAAEGARVVLTDIQSGPGNAVAAEIGNQAVFQRHDVTNAADWKAVLNLTEQRFGTPDILVNNAGTLRFATIADMPPEDFDAVMAINVRSVFLGMQTVGPAMQARGRGSIVNISSTGAMQPTNATAAYAASKAAVQAMTKVAALEFGLGGVRVNSVHPGGVNTPMTNPDNQSSEEVDESYRDIPLQRAARAREIAYLSLYLASDEASFCTGAEFIADGGFLAGRYYEFLPGSPASTD